MEQRLQDLTNLTIEAGILSNKPHLSKQEERRFTWLTSAISAVKAGADFNEFQQADLNDREIKAGITPTRLPKRLSQEQRARGEFFMSLVRDNVGGKKVAGGIEFRSGETIGNPIAQLGTYLGLGSFVPTDLHNSIKEALAESDVLFDVNGPCSVIDSTNGHPYRIPTYNDTGTDAVQIGEGAADGGTDTLLQNPGQVTLGVYSFRSKVHPFSMETFQDLDSAFAGEKLFEKFTAKRMARGIGKALLTGNGSGQTLGLLTALEAAGAPYVVASGSAVNDGTGATGINSLGSQDFANLVFSVNDEYRGSKSAGFLMNTTTLQTIAGVVTKQGLPLVNFVGGVPTILGARIYISPSMPNIGNGNVPVVYGDLSYWYTRLVSDELTRLRVLKEAPGLIENGQYGLQYFMRAGGVLAYTPGTGNCPLSYIVNAT